MATQDQNEAEVRKVLDTLIEGARRKDIAQVMSCYAPDLVAFDLMPPLTTAGAEPYKRNWELAFAMSEGPFGIELWNVVLAVGADVAFAHALQHCTGTSKQDGKPFDMWLRDTMGFRRVDGAWKIVHEHGAGRAHASLARRADDGGDRARVPRPRADDRTTDLLAKLGRVDEARVEFERAASLTRNTREREVSLARAAAVTGARR